MSSEDEKSADQESTGLSDTARGEHEFLHQRLRQELGREPTEEELDDWLRQHTEGY
ncbi:MAG TPA: hypothetical protein VN951_01865 [Pyrinomonadaceae bacterium]|nr:hypothetical protein [Pyrinomonadaceae bacterium]